MYENKIKRLVHFIDYNVELTDHVSREKQILCQLQ